MEKSRFTEEQIVKILEQTATDQRTHAELCKNHGVSVNTFYIWKRKYSAGCRPRTCGK